MSRPISETLVRESAQPVTDAELERLQGAAHLLGYPVLTLPDLIAAGTVVQFVAFREQRQSDSVRLFLHRPSRLMYRVPFGTPTQRVLDAVTAVGECNCTCAVLAPARVQYTVLGSVIDL